MKKGFTLAEVLITLGIIGIVAALTIPTLIAKHKKDETVIKLKRFYSVMNEAQKLSELENDEAISWEYPPNITNKEWYERYLKKYVKTVKAVELDDGQMELEMSDGSAVLLTGANGNLMHIIYNTEPSSKRQVLGKNSFTFRLSPQRYYDYQGGPGYTKNIEPYVSAWDGSRTQLVQRCASPGSTDVAHCAKLIEVDGWSISKDYPIKF